ncbi:response regulator, partial [Klebsiella pneumoniae]
MIKRRQYDLLITDLNMPGMDGLTLAQQVRKINPA